MTENKQVQCRCGRSPTGFCNGMHGMSNLDYEKFCAQQEALKEQTKPQLLHG
jgi:CDGSH-type Zn-finger protein